MRNFVALSGDYTKSGGALFTAERRLSSHIGATNRLPVRLFMAVGGQEETRFRSSAEAMTTALRERGYRGFEIRFLEYPQLDHGTTVSRGIRGRLTWLFSDAAT